MGELLFPEIGNGLSYIDEMGTEAYEELMKYYTEHRVLILNKEIDSSIIESYILLILKWNNEDKKLDVDKRKPITVYINSCGGDLFSCMLFIDVINNSKTPIRTVGLGIIMSAAYYIYINGAERYAFPNTVFLQHDGSITVANSTSKVKDFVAFNDCMEQRIKDMVIGRTKITEDLYDRTFEKEFYFYADKGKELGVVDKIIGEDVDLGSILGE